jgi:NitT/TauT family transport system substrate-binding protein
LLVSACAPAAAPSPTAAPAKPAEAAKPAASPAAAAKPAASPAAAPAAASPAAAAPAAAKPAAPAKDLGKARVVLFDAVYQAPIYVAQEKGFWKEQGLEMELVQAKSGNLVAVALQSNQADFMSSSIESQFGLRLQGGKDVIGVVMNLNRLTLNVVVDKALAEQKGVSRQSPLDARYKFLKGLTIGITAPNAPSDVFMRYYLRKGGANPDTDAELVAIGDASGLLGALKSKRIQAYMLSAPTPQFAEREGFGTILIKSSEGDVPEFADYVYIYQQTMKEYADKNPEIVRAYVGGFNKARSYILDPKNREDVLTILRKYFTSMTDDVLQISLDDTLPAWSKDGKFSEEAMKRTRDIYVDTGQGQPSWKEVSTSEGTLWTNKYMQ